MESFLGIDLGGTKLLIGEVDREGNILNFKKYYHGFFNQRDAVGIINNCLDDYIETVGWYSGHRPVAMGVGVVGRVDSENGIWLQIDPTRTIEIDLANILSGKFDMPCTVDNDVKSATHAETTWGFGQFTDNFIYINVGTGIAVGSVVNGTMIRGSHFNAGEAGHLKVGVNVGVQCGCGRTDCVEAIASGLGFDKCARLLAPQFSTNLHIPDKDARVSVAEVYNLALRGDKLCTVLVDNAAEAIANLIMNMVRVFDPDTVVLGGGVVSDGFLLGHIKKYLHPTTMRFVTNGVVLTKLNPDFIGLLGAASVAMAKHDESKLQNEEKENDYVNA